MLQDSASVVGLILFGPVLLIVLIAVIPALMQDIARLRLRRTVDGYVNRHARMKATGK